MTRAIVVAVALLAAATARADVAVQARGSATVTGGDAAAAKARALDDAFRQAVEQGIATLVEPAARDAGAEVIKKRILRRAKAYVPRYRVLSEGLEDGGVYAVTVEATLADAQLGADLRALGVGAPPPAPVDPRPPDTPPTTARVAPRPSLALLAVTEDRADGEQVWATFGRSAAGGPGPVGVALERELGALGFRVVSAAGVEVPMTTVGDEGQGGPRLPIDATQSAAVAQQVGAGGAVVAAALIKDGGRIRGTRAQGAEVELTVRVDDVATGSFADARIAGAGFGADRAAAAALAGRDAAGRARRALAERLEGRWPEPASLGERPGHDGVLVNLRGVARAAVVAAVTRALAGAPGAKGVVPQRYARREVTLLVRGAAAARALAETLGTTPIAELRLRARAQGATQVDVELTRAAGAPQPLPAQ